MASQQPLSRNPHFFKNPSVISQPLASHGFPQTNTPFSSIVFLPCAGFPNMSPQMSSARNVCMVRMALSRMVASGRRSIHVSCGTDCWSAVGISEGGGAGGGVKRGVDCRASVMSHSGGIRCVTDRIVMFVKVPRKALNCTRGIRWSEESGNTVLPSRRNGANEGAVTIMHSKELLEAWLVRWMHRHATPRLSYVWVCPTAEGNGGW